MVRIAFPVDREDGSVEVETMWASPLHGSTYVLENSPFDVYGVSWQDVVEARRAPDRGEALVYVRTVRKSGHRTVRAIVDRGADPELVVGPMKTLGCSVERASGRLLSMDVPREADLDAVARTLTNAGVLWEHADPTYETLYGDEDENGDED